jgi:high-affinity iron transporter
VWADAVPNLLIGLREGLEGGLLVSILLAAVGRSGAADEDARSATRPVWLGVLAAVMLSLSFGAVLTFFRSELSTRAQEAFGGVVGVIAVVLVTAMVFWMRGAARTLSGEISGKVDVALTLGAGALAATAFLAVAREGLETALFLWTTVQASGETVAPLLGGVIGVAVAVVLCWLLYRRAIRIDLGVFFRRTAVGLVVVAGGVLAYGIGELQSSLLVPGHTWLAFDLTGSVAPDAWWVTIVRGITNLTPSMTWLQVVAYVLYVGVVLLVLLRFRPAPAPAPAERARASRTRVAWARPVLANAWTPVAAAVLVPVAAAGAFALFGTASAAAAARQFTVTPDACAPEFRTLHAGNQSFTVVNKSGRSGDVYFVHLPDGGVVGEAEGVGPGTQRTVTVTVGAGGYAWRCQMSGVGPVQSAARSAVTGGRAAFPRNFAVPPLQPSELEVPIRQYQAYVEGQLTVLTGEVGALRSAIASGSVASARAAWLPAQLTWERVGAAYGSFGDLAGAIDGGPQGLVGGVHDPAFTGLRRIEYGLWHGQSLPALAPYASRLTADVATLRRKLPTVTAAPLDMTLRVHEILEDAQRDHLSGVSDMGAGTGYAETLADVDGTRVVLGELRSLIEERKPGLVAKVESDLDTLAHALAATRHHGVWDDESTGPPAERQRVNAAIGQELETVSPVPDLLEIGAS